MQQTIVFGDAMISVELPDRTHVVSPGLSIPLDPVGDLAAAVRAGLDAPEDLPPLRELARGKRRVTIAFDDATVPCYAPVWSTAIPLVLADLEAAGVRREDVTLLCANALHRKFTHDELATLIGPDLVREFGDRLLCHDAEDMDALEHLGKTPNGYHVELSRHVTDADLCVYVNCSTVRGFSGGWKSICVGLSTYRSIRHHHNPDDMSMSTERNRMHEMLDEMGALVTERLGNDRIFKLETILSNPLQVASIRGGTVDGTRRIALETNRTHMPPRRTLLEEKVDIVLYGVPEWSPYAAFSYLNPILTLISTGLGYLGGMIEALGKPGCSVILATPCRNRWDDTHHPSYREVWERVLPETRDPYQASARFEDEYANHQTYIDRYRFGYGFHPVHAIMALFPLKRLRHAGRVFVAGAEDPGLVTHAGFLPAASVEEALGAALEIHGSDAQIALVPYPPAVNRQL
ncbi:MAG TPA: lactate racemase domain-containing protein [Actinomycetota bacterium]|nr:lactate racemase domain-containing protein [Actinomycetota bacterium]